MPPFKTRISKPSTSSFSKSIVSVITSRPAQVSRATTSNDSVKWCASAVAVCANRTNERVFSSKRRRPDSSPSPKQCTCTFALWAVDFEIDRDGSASSVMLEYLLHSSVQCCRSQNRWNGNNRRSVTAKMVCAMVSAKQRRQAAFMEWVWTCGMTSIRCSSVKDDASASCQICHHTPAIMPKPIMPEPIMPRHSSSLCPTSILSSLNTVKPQSCQPSCPKICCPEPSGHSIPRVCPRIIPQPLYPDHHA